MSEESAVITRLGQLEEAIAKRLAELDAKLSSALLEQERRNSTFATRDRMDELGRKVDVLSSNLASRDQRFAALEEGQRTQAAAITALSAQVSTRALEHIKSLAGWLATLLALILTAIVTWLLTHGHP